MASSARMMLIGIVWLTGMFCLVTLAFAGSIVLKYITDFAMAWHIHPALQQGFGNIWWITGFYYFMILVFAIVLTYRCYQETIVVTDYFPDTGVY